jgi:AMMECR1 domain-containing protein
MLPELRELFLSAESSRKKQGLRGCLGLHHTADDKVKDTGALLCIFSRLGEN